MDLMEIAIFTLLAAICCAESPEGSVENYSDGLISLGSDLNFDASGNLPLPNILNYITQDGLGNMNTRTENRDQFGNVRGSYAMVNNEGLYRTVRYLAGPAGFQATVFSNEPGTSGKENPADVIMVVQEPPPRMNYFN